MVRQLHRISALFVLLLFVVSERRMGRASLYPSPARCFWSTLDLRNKRMGPLVLIRFFRKEVVLFLSLLVYAKGLFFS